MTAYISIRIRDHSDEYSTMRVPVAEMLAVTPWGEYFTNLETLVDAVDDVTLGTIVSWTFSQVGEEFEDERPDSDWAQREFGLRIFYHGENSGVKGNMTVPAPDLAAIDTVPGTDLAVLTDEPVATLITQLQGIAEIAVPNPPPATGYWNDDIIVDRAVVVGRRS